MTYQQKMRKLDSIANGEFDTEEMVETLCGFGFDARFLLVKDRYDIEEFMSVFEDFADTYDIAEDLTEPFDEGTTNQIFEVLYDDLQDKINSALEVCRKCVIDNTEIF